jgi:hypothetical protein
VVAAQEVDTVEERGECDGGVFGKTSEVMWVTTDAAQQADAVAY